MSDLTKYFELLTSESLDERHKAVDKIAAEGKSNPENTASVVIAKLKTSPLETRWYLGRSLIKMGPSIIPTVLEYSSVEQSMDVQKYFAAVLIAFGEPVVPELFKLFESENPACRGMAAAALESIGEPAVPYLINGANSENRQVKLCSELTLSKLGVFEY